MLTQPQVQRYSAQSGLRDIMIAEKEIILTYVLQLFSEKGILGELAFKGGTCLRKMHLGSHLAGPPTLLAILIGQEKWAGAKRDLNSWAAFPLPFFYSGISVTLSPECLGILEIMD